MKVSPPRLDEPVFRFLQINDTHYQTPELQPAPQNFLDANKRVHWLFEALRRGDTFPEVDFLLHVGDLVNTGHESELIAFKRLIDSTGIPYHTVVGNHDNDSGEGQSDKEDPYLTVFGDRFHYTFTHKGLGFVIANNSGTATAKLPPDAILERDRLLREHLESHKSRPVIVACHVPLVPIREEPVMIESFGIPTYKVAEPGMLSILQNHRHHVSAVLSGHVHLSGVVHQQEMAHISVCGTAGFPHEVALHSVYADSLETQLITLPEDMHTPSTNIHGIPWHDRDMTDSTHPDHGSFLRGNPRERLLSIPWKHPLLPC